MTTDKTLCKIVHRETYRGFVVEVLLNRFGGISVFWYIPRDSMIQPPMFQGDNILSARAYIDTRLAHNI